MCCFIYVLVFVNDCCKLNQFHSIRFCSILFRFASVNRDTNDWYSTTVGAVLLRQRQRQRQPAYRGPHPWMTVKDISWREAAHPQSTHHHYQVVRVTLSHWQTPFLEPPYEIRVAGATSGDTVSRSQSRMFGWVSLCHSLRGSRSIRCVSISHTGLYTVRNGWPHPVIVWW